MRKFPGRELLAFYSMHLLLGESDHILKLQGNKYGLMHTWLY